MLYSLPHPRKQRERERQKSRHTDIEFKTLVKIPEKQTYALLKLITSKNKCVCQHLTHIHTKARTYTNKRAI